MARAAALVLALALGLSAVAAQNSPVCQTYVVKSGDTISTIASQFGTTPDKLEAAIQLCVKGYTPGTFLFPSQTICLPGWVEQCAYVKSAGGDQNCKYYTVQSGDTFDTIAQYFGIPRSYIVDANPDVNPATLAVNSFVRLPPYAATCAAPGDNKQCRVYVAQQGDSLSIIATAFSIPLGDLQARAAANMGVDGSTGDGSMVLQPGQRIKLPPFPDTCGNGVEVPKPSSCKAYIVKDGDTLSGIAAMFFTTTNELISLNPSLAAGILSPNTQVILPPSPPPSPPAPPSPPMVAYPPPVVVESPPAAPTGAPAPEAEGPVAEGPMAEAPSPAAMPPMVEAESPVLAPPPTEAPPSGAAALGSSGMLALLGLLGAALALF
ncbi:hypothetical protein ABPG75_001440 [Micractinium tetrahymenae]